MIRYPSSAEVVQIHREVTGLEGGESLLLHPDKLDSALHRPKNAAHYEGADLVSQAICLAVGISQSQAFLDGNKRAAFGAADTFLMANGYRFAGDSALFACWLICVAGNVNADDMNTVIEHMGFDLASELDRSHREDVTERFDGWIRDWIEEYDG